MQAAPQWIAAPFFLSDESAERSDPPLQALTAGCPPTV